MLSDADANHHFSPALRVLEIERLESGCGFHLTRSKWDPYPWVNAVDAGSAAEVAGLRPGDCLLEVNGEDVVGRRVGEVAELVRARPKLVSLLLWNAGANPQCTPEALCCGPMPRNLQRLSACMSSVLMFLECPICLDTIPPPTYQCDNGHLICTRCRVKIERCPICRRILRSRSLLADQVYNALTDAFDLREETQEKRKSKMKEIFKLRSKSKKVPDIRVTQINNTSKRFMEKSSSDDNLSSNSNMGGVSLKTKSLSTNEIFYSVTPVLSRSSSGQKLNDSGKSRNYLDVRDSAAIGTYHGSLEFLERKPEANCTFTATTRSLTSIPSQLTEETLFNCPYEMSCKDVLKERDLLEHFKIAHQGPLIQYFSKNLTLKLNHLENLPDDLCYVVHINGRMFFLKVCKRATVTKDVNSTGSFDVYLWVWYTGNKKISDEYHCLISLCSSNSNSDNASNETLVSLRSPVYSLSKILQKDIMKSGSVTQFSASILEIFKNRLASDLYFNIVLVHEN